MVSVYLRSSAVKMSTLELPSRLLCILGMHRSGTSCLTGSLQETGLLLGDCHTWNPHNKKGNRENQTFVDLHDAVLKANGGAWNAPPSKIVWDDDDIVRAKRLMADNATDKIFGFKDPRTLLVLDGWKKVFPGIEFVGIFRHPLAVSRSLERRNSMTQDEVLDLWYAYNSILYKEYKEKAFPILNFDNDEEVLDIKILSVVRDLGLEGRSGDEKFYSPELKSDGCFDESGLPARISKLYEQLKKIAL